MIARGRPLGFLGLVVAGWIAGRAFLLWPSPADLGRAVTALREVAAVPSAAAATMAQVTFVNAPLVARARGQAPAPHKTTSLSDAQIVALYGLHYFQEVRPVQFGQPASADVAVGAVSPPTTTTAAAVASALRSGSRWSLSAWLVAREGRADPRLGPLLGASQAGARLSYAFDDRHRAGVFVRTSAPLSHGGAEVAAGLQWRPTRAAVTGFVEMRARGGEIIPAAGAFGGGGLALPAGFRLESYGQAGWVGGRNASAFADGQARAGPSRGPAQPQSISVLVFGVPRSAEPAGSTSDRAWGSA